MNREQRYDAVMISGFGMALAFFYILPFFTGGWEIVYMLTAAMVVPSAVYWGLAYLVYQWIERGKP